MPSDRDLLLRLLHGQRLTNRLLLMVLKEEWTASMKAKELLDAEQAGLTTLEASDKAILAKLADAEENGTDLSQEDVAEGQEVLARIAALQAGDDAALTPPVTTDPGTGDSGSTGDDTGAVDTTTPPVGDGSGDVTVSGE